MTSGIRFEWDARKAEANRRKHGISFLLAVQAFDDPLALRDIEGDEHGEVRWKIVGQVGRALVRVTCTIVEEADQEIVRIISARKLTPRERRAYHGNS
ncbi:MAG: BrnT family toxin [Rhizomicrobium sp.]